MEYWDLYDEFGNPLGRTISKGTALREGEYHFAVEIWIVNSRGEFLIQQRSKTCELLPGIWAFTTGRVAAGETTAEGCIRELQEELGLCASAGQLLPLRRIVRRDGTHLIWDLFLLRTAHPLSAFSLQKEEVASVKYVSFLNLLKGLEEKNIFSYPEIRDVAEQVRRITQGS